LTHVLAVDQGTTSSRALLFDASLNLVATAQEEFPQHFPQSGWVEHDPADIWSSTAGVCRAAVERAGLGPGDIAAIGITNQRETTLIWDRRTGEPLGRAIVWQDRRTSATCAELRAGGHEAAITRRTGLLLDPYFSGTKAKWLLDHAPGARERAQAGELLFGTVDTYLIWRMTGGASHVTDATNAARTLLYDIREGRWDPEICGLLDVPMAMLPEVKDCAAEFGVTRADLFGRPIPILGVAGDQQAATVGQACFAPGMLKSTYGTGCFALLNTGDALVQSRNRLLGTIAYQLDGKATYALEGLDLHRGRGGAMAARRAQGDPGGGRDAGARGGGRSGAGALPRASLHGAGGALLGRGGARRDLRADAGLGPGGVRARGARERRVPDARPLRGDAARLAGRGRGARAAGGRRA
jgi:glycerol kinase